jgi:hypothetical protein
MYFCQKKVIMRDSQPEQDEDSPETEEFAMKNSAFILISFIIGLLLALWFTL